MLDEIKGLFKEGLEYTHTAGILQQVSNLLNILNVQYMKDVDAKNKGIDLVCDLLQGHKEHPPLEQAPKTCCEGSKCH